MTSTRTTLGSPPRWWCPPDNKTMVFLLQCFEGPTRGVGGVFMTREAQRAVYWGLRVNVRCMHLHVGHQGQVVGTGQRHRQAIRWEGMSVVAACSPSHLSCSSPRCKLLA